MIKLIQSLMVSRYELAFIFLHFGTFFTANIFEIHPTHMDYG